MRWMDGWTGIDWLLEHRLAVLIISINQHQSALIKSQMQHFSATIIICRSGWKQNVEGTQDGVLNYMRATLSSMEFLKRKAWLLVNLVMRKFFSLQDDDDLVGQWPCCWWQLYRNSNYYNGDGARSLHLNALVMMTIVFQKWHQRYEHVAP